MYLITPDMAGAVEGLQRPAAATGDTAQVKPTDSAQRLSRHEQPVTYGLLQRLPVVFAKFVSFVKDLVGLGGAPAATQASAGPFAELSQMNPVAELLKVSQKQAAKVLESFKGLTVEQFMQVYEKEMNTDGFIRKFTLSLNNLDKLAQFDPQLKTQASISSIEIIDGFSLKSAKLDENIKRITTDRDAAGKVYALMHAIATQFASLEDPDSASTAQVQHFIDSLVSLLNNANHSIALPVQGVSGEAVLPSSDVGAATTEGLPPDALLSRVKFGFDSQGYLPNPQQFDATMMLLREPSGPLYRLFEHFEALAEQGSADERAIVGAVLKHTVAGQIYPFGELFGQRQEEANVLQAHSAIAMMEVLQNKCSTAVRQLQALNG